MKNFLRYMLPAAVIALGLAAAGCEIAVNVDDGTSCGSDCGGDRCAPWTRFAVPAAGDDVWVVNNIFNAERGSSSYEQCVSVEGPDDDPVIRWNWEWPESDTLVSFPEIVVGYKPWDDPPARSDYPVSVGSFDATAYFDADIHAQGNYNVSFDIWCVDSDRPVVSSITHEVMIWLENSSLVPFGEKTATVSLGQVEYELWIAESHPDITGRTSHRWTYIAFVPVSEGTVRKVGLDLSLFFDYLTQNGYMPGSTKIASVELGTQIMSGTGSVTVSGFRIDMQ